MDKLTIKIPFLKDAYCYELTVKQYKILLKSLFTDELDDVFLLNVNNILSAVTTLTTKQLLDLNFIQYFALFIFIRSTSFGNSLPLIVTDNNKKINLDVDLSKTLINLAPALYFNEQDITENNIIITVGLPTIKKFIEEDIDLTLFIKKIIIKDLIITNISDFNKVLNALKPKHINLVNQFYAKTVKMLQTLLFYKSFEEKYNIPLVSTPVEILYLLKLLFGESLINIYDDIFYLSKHVNMSAEFLENCTPGEFKIFSKNLEEMLSIKDPTTENINEQIQDATGEFEQMINNNI
jgi:hypothetical protein